MVRDRSKNKKTHKKALGLLNKPSKPTKAKQTYDRIACVFQGGGALGAYQVGAYHAIHEKGYRPNYLAGVSIGSITSAIIAGNPPETQLQKLRDFWETIAPTLWGDSLRGTVPNEFIHFYNHMGALQCLLNGLDGFFKPRPIPPSIFSHDTPNNLSYYDTSELKSTLERLIDFDRINSQEVTLCLGAVNIASGEMCFFNNEQIEITPEHVMASGALPPGLPAVKIGDDYFWDGGIYANTPLVAVLDALPEQDTLCFVVDCFSLKGRLPHTMDELEERQKDIRYASHSRRMTNVYASRQNLKTAINILGKNLNEEAKRDSEIKKILELGHQKRFSVVHVIFNASPYAHSFKDYNFVRSAIDYRLKVGYRDAKAVLDNPDWENKTEKKLSCSIYGVPDGYFEQR